MALNKKERTALRVKFGGRCAYCGQVLGDKWHADHLEPVVRNDWLQKFGAGSKAPNYPERDVVENMNPSCVPCNLDKHSMSIEQWRGVIERSNQVLMRDSSTFRRAVRYGLIQIIDKPVRFYFEDLGGQV